MSAQISINEEILAQLLDKKLNEFKSDLLKEVSSKLEPLQKEILILSDKFDEFKGDTNERLLRENVQKLYGETFSRRFCVQGISGLVRLLTPPRKIQMQYHPRDLLKAFQHVDSQGNSKELSDSQLQEEGVKEIVGYIHEKGAAYSCLSLLLKQVTELSDTDIGDIVNTAQTIKLFSSLNDTKCEDQQKSEIGRVAALAELLDKYDKPIEGNYFCRLFAHFLKFVKMVKGQQVKELKSDSGLGLMIFCASFPNVSGYFPIIDLEFDCRGEIDQYTGTDDKVYFTIVAGEIKSSKSGILKAKTQLSKRLGIMKEALMLMPHYKVLKKATPQVEPTVVTRGVIFLPNNESKDIGMGNAVFPSSNDFSLEFVFC